MAVFVSNITIEQGFDFDTSFQLEDTRTNTPLVLNGAATEGMLRKSYTSASAVSFASTVSDDVNGIISISLTSSQTVALKAGRYVYDVELILSDSTIEKVHYGIITVNPEATKV